MNAFIPMRAFKMKLFLPQCKDNTCPLNLSCSRTGLKLANHVATDGSVDFLIVGENASLDDYLSSVPFSGLEGSLIEEASKDCGKTLAFSYLVRGWPVDLSNTREPLKSRGLAGASSRDLQWIRSVPLKTLAKSEIISRCINFLKADIEFIKPKQIIILGSEVQEALFPNASNRPSTNKMVHWNGYPVHYLPSPIGILKSAGTKDWWVRSLKTILTGQSQVASFSTTVGKTVILKTKEEVINYVNFLRNTPVHIGVDTETLNLNKRYNNRLLTVQFATDSQTGYVIPIKHSESPFSGQDLQELEPLFFDLFNKPSKIKSWVTHNAKFENALFICNFGTQLLSAPIYDTGAAAFFLDENRSERKAEFKYFPYSLKQLCLDYNNFDGYNKGVLAAREEGGMADLSLQMLAEYGAMDAYQTWLLRENTIKEAKKQNYFSQLMDLMLYLYTPMVRLFSDIEHNGLPFDYEYLKFLRRSPQSPIKKELDSILESLSNIPQVVEANKRLLHDKTMGKGGKRGTVEPLFGVPWIFDFAKKEHPSKLFFEVMGLKPVKFNPTGASVDKEFQEAYSDTVPLVKTFSDWVEFTTLEKTFVKSLYERADSPDVEFSDSSIDKHVRPDFKITSVVTGRMACKNPNLQNIPRADNEGKKAVKNVFAVHDMEECFIQFDFKANEMRWVGIVSKDEAMAKNFQSGYVANQEFRKNPTKDNKKKAEIYGDVHRQNASRAFNINIEEVTKDQRQKAKGISFGVLYGASVKTIANKYSVDYDDCARMFDDFFKVHSSVANWKDEMNAMAEQSSFVEYPNGRRRRFPLFNLFTNKHTKRFDQNLVPREFKSITAEALRQSTNAPVQGIASDAAMLGAAFLADYIRENNKTWRVVNAVHDSTLTIGKISELEEILRVTEECLTTKVSDYMSLVWGIEFNLPIEVDAEVGFSWGDMIKWDGTNLPEVLTWLEEQKKIRQAKKFTFDYS